MERLYFSPVESEFGRLWALNTPEGLARLVLHPSSRHTIDPGPSILSRWRDRYAPDHYLMESPTRFRDLQKWLKQYAEGFIPDVEIPVDLKGTPFQQKVWEIVARIPYGNTITYGLVSRKLRKKSSSARAVGSAVGSNPVPLVVPCHRVIGESGKLVGFGGGLKMKQDLLRREGILLL